MKTANEPRPHMERQDQTAIWEHCFTLCCMQDAEYDIMSLERQTLVWDSL